ncbi:MAG: GNAT family N-acetyltransferase [Tsuneonella suprasediminis]|uniref:GNAT family N-acetyltransferase n=1 Tax=Tsuneonella suprasediminis TaxID=2306996 RepID=A0A419QXR8_9SPHN|nr:GNAT family N-acetyltransferase [Tsuneonella suprasediminis]RJX65467.1 GNAT family N-acetyltransferase [Tsuneonella suprasediminis]UBS33719.1 GNAT family N-acetyltransferase [Altererythrobacter sp. N1]
MMIGGKRMASSTDFILKTVAPSDMSDEAKDAFKALVISAGEVNAQTLPALVEAAVALVMLYDGDKLFGTAAVKRPHDSHRRDYFRKAKVGASADSYLLELGWIVVHLDYRGQHLASKLIGAALEGAGGSKGIYATTKNDKMLGPLAKFGFVVQGEPFPSSLDNTVNLTLFARSST